MNSLADVVSGAGLSVFADIALVIFLAVFVAVLARVLFAKRSHYEREASLPLEDDVAASPSPPRSSAPASSTTPPPRGP